MDPVDEFKTAFSTRYGTFQWRVLPLGLCNAPSTFQRAMQRIFAPLIGRCLFIYLDDLIIFSTSVEANLKQLRAVTELLRKNQLYLNAAKCEFAHVSLSFLGHIVGPGAIAMESGKVQAITTWPQPTTKKELQGFLGLANYYRRFIAHFAELAAPLTDMLQDYCPGAVDDSKGTAERSHFLQAPACNAFAALKAAIASHPVLRMPNPQLPFTITCDASDVAVGAVLEQDDGHGPRPVAFISKKLSAAELNYAARDKELLGVTYSLQQFRVYVLGKHFTLRTDHQSLQYLLTQRTLTGRLARWAEIAAEFDFEIIHIPGACNHADGLSRPPATPEVDAATASVAAAITSETTLSASPLLGTTAAWGNLQHDKDFGSVFRHLTGSVKEGPTTAQKAKRFALDHTGNGLLLVEGQRRCVAAGRHRLLVLQEGHDSASAAHQGVDRTYEGIAQLFYWPGLSKDVSNFVESCEGCQRNKAATRAMRAAHQPLPAPPGPWDTVSMDFMELPLSLRGHDSLLVVHDMGTGHLRLIPTSARVDAQGVAELFLQNIYPLHGLPRVIVSDRDPRFVAEIWAALWTALGTRLRMTTAHRPQADGATERANRTIQEALRAFVNSVGSDWDAPSVLPVLEFALNSYKRAGRPDSAFGIMGHNPRSPLHLLADTQAPALPLAGKLATAWMRARDAISDSKDKQAAAADKIARPYAPAGLVVGAMALLSVKNYPTYRAHKLCPKYIGPFRVLRVQGSSVTLDLPRRMRIHSTINMDQLKLFDGSASTAGTPWPDRVQPPPPPLLDANNNQMFIIERFLQTRVCRGKRQYLVRWKGYQQQDDSWEPWEAVKHCTGLLANFQATLPRQP